MTQGNSKLMANPKGNEASLRESRFKAAWRSGSTRTIRVPVVLADATLEYAHQLDKGLEQRDTMNKVSLDSEVPTTQFIDTSDSTDEVKQLEAEFERLQNEVGNLRAENEKLTRQLQEVRSQTVSVSPEFELPEAADLLNKLKAKRKKSTASLADIEALLEMMEVS